VWREVGWYAPIQSGDPGGYFFNTFSHLTFPTKLRRPENAGWQTQVVDHLVPNQVRGSFESLGESERGKFSVFKGLREALIGADPEKLKMRCFPPTFSLDHSFYLGLTPMRAAEIRNDQPQA